MALAGIRQRALREALPAPVEDRDREAARARVAHHLEIFLDEFGAARKHAQRALAPGRRLEAGKAQHHAVGRLHGSDGRALGNRIGGDGDEFHAEPEALAIPAL